MVLNRKDVNSSNILKVLNRELRLATGISLDKVCDRFGVPQEADLVDIAVAVRGQEVDLILAEKNEEKIRSIRLALENVKEGNFGICLVCEEQISQARLNAVPWAVRCVFCEESRNSESENEHFRFDNRDSLSALVDLYVEDGQQIAV